MWGGAFWDDTVRQKQWLTINPADHELRFRDGAGEHAGPPAAPGEVYEPRSDVAATGYEFAAGHRVRVEVSSSAFDRWDRNPNTGHAFGVDTAADLRVAHQTVYHDGERPSRIVLPLAPADVAA